MYMYTSVYDVLNRVSRCGGQKLGCLYCFLPYLRLNLELIFTRMPSRSAYLWNLAKHQG